MRRRSRWTEAGAATALLVATSAAGVLAWRAIGPGGTRFMASTLHDAAGLLSEEQRRSIEAHHELLLRDHGIDYRIETLRGSGELERYANRRFAELEVGARSRSGRGLLLVVDAGQDRVRLEVGRALEGAFPDVFVAYLEQRQMEPFFRARRVGDGILAATELLVERIAEEPEPRDAAQAGGAGSAGGGASARAALGRGAEPAARTDPDVAAQHSPEAAVDAYLEAMRHRNGRPDLDLYTRATRDLLAGRAVTDAQMDSVARTHRGCRPEPARLDPGGALAVVRYPPAARRCSPWLLVREDAGWRLDLATASRAIRFGRDNSWHFAAGAPADYAYAFADWSFDRHGFPR